MAQSYYDAHRCRSYFDGCSTGGRQGLIVGAALPRRLRRHRRRRAGARLLRDDDQLRAASSARWRAAPISPRRSCALSPTRSTAKCDAIDGVADGVIDDPARAARFDPAARSAAVRGGADDAGCFTAAQIARARGDLRRRRRATARRLSRAGRSAPRLRGRASGGALVERLGSLVHRRAEHASRFRLDLRRDLLPVHGVRQAATLATTG